MTNELIAILSMGAALLGSNAALWLKMTSIAERVAKIEDWLEGWRAPRSEGGQTT